ncbi:NADH-quinone oxidoreductase subunit F [Sedimentibacter acidaminivorans]|jgi:NADH-quinone oxidoreductase subunit F|uniref:NADH-quinone oxidoreductase subunit F n=1 Tax=Sedimentibacter acidaminivorans TaxID=913099 RepID=A0ABS4GDB9_9FIRM|nr:NADH-quinone oxidoreductase subunit NuoF [Sedimentibacter acidaminivorans]MBP1925681.1 NADH-quinone oxidoreductase subunit F [Sedimentibacter acidaminivorans]
MKVLVGLGSCGIAAGGRKVLESINESVAKNGLDIIVEPTGCVGMCFHEPLVDIIDGDKKYTYGHVNAEIANKIVESHLVNGKPLTEYLIYTNDEPDVFVKNQLKVALENCGQINPENINDYLEVGGYKALEKVLTSMKQEEVIEEMKISGLRGRGGAGFPTWFKWDAALKSKGTEKYVVCNADEGDPGAFMDRSVLEGDPHKLIEGMIICGFAMGSNHGVIYCRAEYPLAIKRLNIAIEQATEKNYLGENILGTGFSFDLRIKMGAGAFVCGEETALIESLEGKRGMPRLKPPFPAQSGYWRKPTNINNVETFANVSWIISHGPEKFAAIGTEKSKGTKVFALSGKIKLGGLAEVPMGMTLREVIFGIGGGIKGDKKFKAVQLGGPSGGCLPESLLDTPVTYEDLSKTGAIVGSGGMVVMDETTCIVDVTKFFLEFTCNESCGKCTYCRVGTKRMLQILEKITEGNGTMEDLDELEALALSVKDASLCGLGQTAPNPVLTSLKYFRDEYIAHIVDKKCPAKKCTALLTYNIDTEKCTGCTLCARKCPVQAIDGTVKNPHVIIQDKCIKCGNCYTACKFGAVEII